MLCALVHFLFTLWVLSLSFAPQSPDRRTVWLRLHFAFYARKLIGRARTRGDQRWSTADPFPSDPEGHCCPIRRNGGKLFDWQACEAPFVVSCGETCWAIRSRWTLESVWPRVLEQNGKCEMRDGCPKLAEARCQAEVVAQADARARCRS